MEKIRSLRRVMIGLHLVIIAPPETVAKPATSAPEADMRALPEAT